MSSEKMMICICGGRKYRFDLADIAWLDLFAKRCNVFHVIHGDQTGADTCADIWAKCRGFGVTPFPPDMASGRGNSPFYHRNTAMARYLHGVVTTGQYSAAAVIRFPGGRGTELMCEIARSYEIDVIRPTFDAQSINDAMEGRGRHRTFVIEEMMREFMKKHGKGA